MTNPPDRELAVFSAARQMPVQERAAYLDEACVGDADLRQRVEELLQANESAGDFSKVRPPFRADRMETLTSLPIPLRNLETGLSVSN